VQHVAHLRSGADFFIPPLLHVHHPRYHHASSEQSRCCPARMYRRRHGFRREPCLQLTRHRAGRFPRVIPLRRRRSARDPAAAQKLKVMQQCQRGSTQSASAGSAGGPPLTGVAVGLVPRQSSASTLRPLAPPQDLSTRSFVFPKCPPLLWASATTSISSDLLTHSQLPTRFGPAF
jgi:hypothetical protein